MAGTMLGDNAESRTFHFVASLYVCVVHEKVLRQGTIDKPISLYKWELFACEHHRLLGAGKAGGVWERRRLCLGGGAG